MTRNHIFRTHQNSNNVDSMRNQIPKNIDIEKLKLFLGEVFNSYKDNPKALGFWYNSLLTKLTRDLMKQGRVPKDFTTITLCRSCGYVYAPPELINDGSGLGGCPWCWSRVKGLPIPRPVAIDVR